MDPYDVSETDLATLPEAELEKPQTHQVSLPQLLQHTLSIPETTNKERRRGRRIVPTGDPKLDARRKQQRDSQRVLRQRKKEALLVRSRGSTPRRSTIQQNKLSSGTKLQVSEFAISSVGAALSNATMFTEVYDRQNQRLKDPPLNTYITALDDPFEEVPDNLFGMSTNDTESWTIDGNLPIIPKAFRAENTREFLSGETSKQVILGRTGLSIRLKPTDAAFKTISDSTCGTPCQSLIPVQNQDRQCRPTLGSTLSGDKYQQNDSKTRVIVHGHPRRPAFPDSPTGSTDQWILRLQNW